MSTPVTGAPRVPDKPTLDGLEDRWAAAWDEDGHLPLRPRAPPGTEVFSIDTPPPTVSGSLHMGSVFGYVQTDAIARYRRMRGWKLFYPMGWDDNGLPTERRVQTYFGVKCDPSLPYDPDFAPPEEPGKEDIAGQPAQLHRAVPRADGRGRAGLRGRCGGASGCRSTGPWATPPSTTAAGGRASACSCATWPGARPTRPRRRRCGTSTTRRRWHRPRWRTANSRAPTTACASTTSRSRRPGPSWWPPAWPWSRTPTTSATRDRFGTTVHTPLFGVEVPVLAHRLAEPDKGSGIAMICTFGDVTDVVWWRELDLPTRNIVTRTGRITEAPPPGVPDGEAWRAIAGRTVKQAQRAMVEMLAASGDMVGEPRPITHPVKFYERGERPLEIVTSRQWFIRNGGRDETLRQALLARGDGARLAPALHAGPLRRLGERPQQRLARRAGSASSVCRSRSGTRSAPTASRTTTSPDRARRGAPARRPHHRRAPRLHAPTQRGAPGGFVGDPDVMDTWATSSLTPQIACGWEDDPDLFAATFPMDLRPQGPRSSAPGSSPPCLRSHLEHHVVPWQHTTHQRLGPRPGPQEDVQVQGQRRHADAAGGRVRLRRRALLGLQRPARAPTPRVDTGVMKIGRRLAIKILNASKFALGRLGEGAPPGIEAVHEPLDLALLAQLADVVDDRNGGATSSSTTPARSGGHRDLLLVLLRRLRRAGQDAGLRRGRRRRHRLGPGHPGAGPLGPDPALRPLRSPS